MKINTNFSSVELGETICYHAGNLSADRQQAVEDNGKSVFSDEAVTLQQVATIALKKSTTLLPERGTGEFELKQKRIGFNNYLYLAKRIKPRA